MRAGAARGEAIIPLAATPAAATPATVKATEAAKPKTPERAAGTRRTIPLQTRRP
jgi:hypothetical protein